MSRVAFPRVLVRPINYWDTGVRVIRTIYPSLIRSLSLPRSGLFLSSSIDLLRGTFQRAARERERERDSKGDEVERGKVEHDDGIHGNRGGRIRILELSNAWKRLGYFRKVSKTARFVRGCATRRERRERERRSIFEDREKIGENKGECIRYKNVREKLLKRVESRRIIARK